MPPRSDLTVTGTIDDAKVDDDLLFYIAAAPPNYRYSFTGAGQPFADAPQAFYDTPNKGKVIVSAGGKFSIPLAYPNTYYQRAGSVKVPPTLYLMWHSGGKEKRASLVVAEGIPYRYRDYPQQRKDRGAMFYAKQKELPVRTQEQVLRDGAYPSSNKEAYDFWGLRPPL